MRPKKLAQEFLLMTLGTALVSVGVYFFKFPNHFSICLLYTSDAADD